MLISLKFNLFLTQKILKKKQLRFTDVKLEIIFHLAQIYKAKFKLKNVF